MRNCVEFYLGTNAYPFCTVEAEFQPNEGELINIKGCTYRVLGRSFTVDNADSVRSMRCNVIVKRDS